MPELLEVEIYRHTAVRSIGRVVAAIEVLDPFGLRHGSEASSAAAIAAAVVGSAVVEARRRGKLLLLDLAAPGAAVHATLGIRFGMTGRLLVDEAAGIDGLLYSSDRNDPAWDRFRLRFVDGGSLTVRDPRRLGGVVLDPNEDALGIDAMDLTRPQLAAAVKGSTSAVKARLLDQHRIAGIGNLLADEILWRAGISPQAEAGRLGPARVTRLHEAVVETLRELGERGGSHMGDVMAARRPGGQCPRDGTPMKCAQIGGRTTYWCPAHQR